MNENKNLCVKSESKLAGVLNKYPMLLLEVLNQVGTIFCMYLPELAEFFLEERLLTHKQIVSIEDCLCSKKYWDAEFYAKLKWLKHVSIKNYH
jgi:hypothetical protein